MSSTDAATPEDACFVVDCGTGQCRCLRLSQPTGGGAVTLRELGDLPLLREAVEKAQVTEWCAALGTAIETGQKGQKLTVACSAWYRSLSEEQRNAFTSAFKEVERFIESRGMRYHTLLLEGDEEAQCELAAVRYAAGRVLGYQPHVVLSGGKGSSQIAAGDNVCSLALALGEGQKRVEAGESDKWSEQVATAAAAGVRSWPQLPAQTRVVAISGLFYGAKAAGLATGAAAEPLSCSTCCERLAAAAAEEGKEPQNVANWLRMRGLLSSLPIPDLSEATIVFGRDWIVDGVPFRTTWAAGMFVREKERLM